MSRLAFPALIVVMLALEAGLAQAQDVAICFDTADSVVSGETVDEATKQAGPRSVPTRARPNFKCRTEISSAGSRFRHHRHPT